MLILREGKMVPVCITFSIGRLPYTYNARLGVKYYENRHVFTQLVLYSWIRVLYQCRPCHKHAVGYKYRTQLLISVC